MNYRLVRGAVHAFAENFGVYQNPGSNAQQRRLALFGSNCPAAGEMQPQSQGAAWYSALMSKAFTKEAEGGEVYDDLPDRPVSPHNLVTPKGLEMIEAELARLHLEHAAAQDADDRPRLAKINRDLRYWTSRRATAQVVEPPRDAAEVHFGSTVTIERDDGRRQTYRIVGEDEADPSLGTLSYVSPVAQALMGKEKGETVQAGHAEATIVGIT